MNFSHSTQPEPAISALCPHCQDHGAVCNAQACDRARPGRYTVDQCHPCWKRLYGAAGAIQSHANLSTGRLSTTKPKLTIDQLGAIKRCQEAKKKGEECKEDIRFMDVPINSPSTTQPSRIRWAYGVTSVISRVKTYLPQTLYSLEKAGFPSPRLFIDNCTHEEAITYSKEFGVEVTARHPTIRTAGNWILTLWELYIRQPDAERYAMFQDDFVCYQNLKPYLERWYPGERNDSPRGYLNLYLFPSNEAIVPKDGENPKVGWYLSNQMGKGAVALVFSRECVIELLSHKHLAQRTADMHRGHKAIDGGVVTALGEAGWKEYVHYPSLVQHMGHDSAMGNKPHPQAPSFRGDDFDALKLLGRK